MGGMKMKKLFLFVLILALIPSFSVSASDDCFESTLTQLRSEFFGEKNYNSNPQSIVEVPQIFIDKSSVVHTPPEQLALPLDEGIGIRPANIYLPFTQGQTRTFRDPNQTGTLTRQGTRVNIWTMNPAVASQVDTAMIARLDLIVNRMEMTFAPFTGVRVNTAFANLPVVGDVQGDGRINVLLHSHTGGGWFSASDYSTSNGHTPLPLVHVGSGLISNRDVLYDVFAHEVSHLLFNLYFEIYAIVAGAQVTGQEFLWFNEALSELAGFLYANPGSETIPLTRAWRAADNSYANPGDGRVGDFLNFNNSLKNYGMSNLHGVLMYRQSMAYTRAVFNYFRAAFPPATSSTQYINNHNLVQYLGMTRIIGDALHAAGLTGSTDARGTDAFNLLYFIFMEAFAADGGSVNGLSVPAFLNSPFSAHNLWGIRPSMGTSNVLFSSASGNGFNPMQNGMSTPLPTRASNAAVVMTGFNGIPPRGASHERIYRLNGQSTANPVINIAVNDIYHGTRFYVVVPNDPIGAVSSATNRQFGSQGARVVSLRGNGARNYINTGGQIAYLYVVTLHRNVNTTINYTWQNAVPPVLLGDVDGNGIINSADVTMLKRFLLASSPEAFIAANPTFIPANARVSGGNTVTSFDLTMLKLNIVPS
jgi:hypothetical protein